jgi:hypothetical protein
MILSAYILYTISASSLWFVVIYVKDCALQPGLADHIIQRAGNSAGDVNVILSLKICFVMLWNAPRGSPSAKEYKEKVRAKKRKLVARLVR